MPQDELEKFNDAFETLSKEEKERLIASIMGETVEEQLERKRINQESQKYRDLQIEQWPPFTIEWDFSPSNFNFVLDGVKKDEFQDHYPHGLRLGFVNFQEFDSKLAKFSKRANSELWHIGSPGKVARAIVHWVEGNTMTPPLIIPQGSEINISAGHHRTAVCKAKQIKVLPILADVKNCKQLEQILLSIKWEN